MDLLEEEIVSLIDHHIGDFNRLNEMLDRHRSGKTLYNSDIDYIEKLSPTTKITEIEEKPINLDELRKSQPKPKYKKRNIKFGVSHSQSGRSIAKLHKASCRYVQNSSQAGDIKWDYLYDFDSAKVKLQNYGSQYYANCCMRNFPFNLIVGAFFASLIFGIFGGLLAWYITKDYFPRLAKGWLVFSLLSTSFYLFRWIQISL